MTSTTVKDIRSELKLRLQGIVPEMELTYKAELVDQIRRLKKEKNAVILGHNYMEPALFYSIPDFRGDSLELCRQAQKTVADIIVFCGVVFMAETAKILNPTKKVLIPSEKAGCSLAESITGQDVIRLKELFPGVPVVCYINTYADVKAQCDVCCTSGNAAKIIGSFDSEKVIFLPDAYLAKNVARETGKKIIFPTVHSTKEITYQKDEPFDLIGWDGRCEVHDLFTVQDIVDARKQYPDVSILAHPECRPEVAAAADFVGSTSAMISYITSSQKPRYLLLTECSMGDNIAVAHPEKEMVRMCSMRCQYMNQITLEETLRCLEQEKFEIQVPEPTRSLAHKSISRMLDFH